MSQQRKTSGAKRRGSNPDNAPQTDPPKGKRIQRHQPTHSDPNVQLPHKKEKAFSTKVFCEDDTDEEDRVDEAGLYLTTDDDGRSDAEARDAAWMRFLRSRHSRATLPTNSALPYTRSLPTGLNEAWQTKSTNHVPGSKTDPRNTTTGSDAVEIGTRDEHSSRRLAVASSIYMMSNGGDIEHYRLLDLQQAAIPLHPVEDRASSQATASPSRARSATVSITSTYSASTTSSGASSVTIKPSTSKERKAAVSRGNSELSSIAGNATAMTSSHNRSSSVKKRVASIERKMPSSSDMRASANIRPASSREHDRPAASSRATPAASRPSSRDERSPSVDQSISSSRVAAVTSGTSVKPTATHERRPTYDERRPTSTSHATPNVSAQATPKKYGPVVTKEEPTSLHTTDTSGRPASRSGRRQTVTGRNSESSSSIKEHKSSMIGTSAVSSASTPTPSLVTSQGVRASSTTSSVASCATIKSTSTERQTHTAASGNKPTSSAVTFISSTVSKSASRSSSPSKHNSSSSRQSVVSSSPPSSVRPVSPSPSSVLTYVTIKPTSSKESRRTLTEEQTVSSETPRSSTVLSASTKPTSIYNTSMVTEGHSVTSSRATPAALASKANIKRTSTSEPKSTEAKVKPMPSAHSLSVPPTGPENVTQALPSNRRSAEMKDNLVSSHTVTPTVGHRDNAKPMSAGSCVESSVTITRTSTQERKSATTMEDPVSSSHHIPHVPAPLASSTTPSISKHKSTELKKTSISRNPGLPAVSSASLRPASVASLDSSGATARPALTKERQPSMAKEGSTPSARTPSVVANGGVKWISLNESQPPVPETKEAPTSRPPAVSMAGTQKKAIFASHAPSVVSWTTAKSALTSERGPPVPDKEAGTSSHSPPVTTIGTTPMLRHGATMADLACPPRLPADAEEDLSPPPRYSTMFPDAASGQKFNKDSKKEPEKWQTVPFLLRGVDESCRAVYASKPAMRSTVSLGDTRTPSSLPYARGAPASHSSCPCRDLRRKCISLRLVIDTSRRVWTSYSISHGQESG
ncbi:hypothetical protein A0H81_12765 [Grifola frondosa]|uniref:Uncharacterized protein n=1 Tax=Grifola frondosa TaxID=5627 RepID=A0A1C7LRE9_GRIFR|nr:hypothetical protein A0H81_12765 [Grifola frondosa]